VSAGQISSKANSQAASLPNVSGLKCPQCGVVANESLRLCPTCYFDLGCPNVRAAAASNQVSALGARFAIAADNATKKGCTSEFEGLFQAITKSSHVVVAMPANYARNFLKDRRTVYASYEKLVGSGSRVPAAQEHDTERCAIGGKFFGSYADQIRYGVLSLDGTSLPNYGLVFVRLRDVSVQNRVTFLHENSFLFAKNNSMTFDASIPPGFICDWQNRANLAAAKMEPTLSAGSNITDWAHGLVRAGLTRRDDDCIEAHIFGGFNAEAVQSVSFGGIGADHSERMDIQVIQEIMAIQAGGHNP
jgi:hypothetical protein